MELQSIETQEVYGSTYRRCRFHSVARRKASALVIVTLSVTVVAIPCAVYWSRLQTADQPIDNSSLQAELLGHPRSLVSDSSSIQSGNSQHEEVPNMTSSMTANCSHGVWNARTSSCQCFHGWSVAGITDTIDFLKGACEQYHCKSAAVCEEVLHIPGASCPVRGWNCYCGWYYAFSNYGGGFDSPMDAAHPGGKCMGLMYTFAFFISLLVESFLTHAWKVFLPVAVAVLPFGRKRAICDHHRPSLWLALRRCFGMTSQCSGECVMPASYTFDAFLDDIAWTVYVLDVGVWSYLFAITLWVVVESIWSILLWMAVITIIVCSIIFGMLVACGEGIGNCCCAGDCCAGGGVGVGGCNCCDICFLPMGGGHIGGAGSMDAMYWGGTFPYDPWWGYGGGFHDDAHGGGGCLNFLCKPVAVLLYLFPVMPENAWGGFVGYFFFGTHIFTPTQHLYRGGNEFIEFFSMSWRRRVDLHSDNSWRLQVYNFLSPDEVPGEARPAQSGVAGEQTTFLRMHDGEERRVVQIGRAHAVLIDVEFDQEEHQCVPSSFEDYQNNACWICMGSCEEWDLWLSCKHLFCKNCSTEMLRRRMPCPLCRVSSSTVLRGKCLDYQRVEDDQHLEPTLTVPMDTAADGVADWQAQPVPIVNLLPNDQRTLAQESRPISAAIAMHIEGSIPQTHQPQMRTPSSQQQDAFAYVQLPAAPQQQDFTAPSSAPEHVQVPTAAPEQQEYRIRLTRPLSAGIENDCHHLHIRQLRAFADEKGDHQVSLKFRDASEYVKMGENGKYTPDNALSGLLSGMVRSAGSGAGVNYGTQDHWMEFESQQPIALVELYNQLHHGSRLVGAYLEVFHGERLLCRHHVKHRRMSYRFAVSTDEDAPAISPRLDTMRDTLLHFERVVDEDSECRQLISNLLQYARDQVTKNLPTIQSSLKKHGVKVLDMIWPGAGYNSVACGGCFEVLTILERMKLLNVGNLMGASGGAASTILALADLEDCSRVLLRSYMIYAMWKKSSTDLEIKRQTRLWKCLYQRVIEQDAAFARLQQRGWVATWTGGLFRTEEHNVVFHNFSTREQCAAAFFASGEMSLSMLRGIEIPGVSDKLGKSSDGGQITYFPKRQAHLLFYNTVYGLEKYFDGYTSRCTLESIDILFRHGVDDTVRLLCSADLSLDKDSHWNGGMKIVHPRLGQHIGDSEFKDVHKSYPMMVTMSATFYDVQKQLKYTHATAPDVIETPQVTSPADVQTNDVWDSVEQVDEVTEKEQNMHPEISGQAAMDATAAEGVVAASAEMSEQVAEQVAELPEKLTTDDQEAAECLDNAEKAATSAAVAESDVAGAAAVEAPVIAASTGKLVLYSRQNGKIVYKELSSKAQDVECGSGSSQQAVSMGPKSHVSEVGVQSVRLPPDQIVQGDVTQFTVEVTPISGGAPWHVMHRYNDFADLCSQLGVTLSAPFPKKTFTGCSGARLQQRREALETWLSEFVTFVQSSDNAALRASMCTFLQMPAASTSATPTVLLTPELKDLISTSTVEELTKFLADMSKESKAKIVDVIDKFPASSCVSEDAAEINRAEEIDCGESKKDAPQAKQQQEKGLENILVEKPGEKPPVVLLTHELKELISTSTVEELTKLLADMSKESKAKIVDAIDKFSKTSDKTET